MNETHDVDPQTGLAARHATLVELQRRFGTFFARPPKQRPWIVVATLEDWPSFLGVAGLTHGETLLRELGASILAVLPPRAFAGRLDGLSVMILLDACSTPAARELTLELATRFRALAQHPTASARLATAGTTLDEGDLTWRHPMTRIEEALDRARSEGARDPVFQLTHVGERPERFTWQLGSGASRRFAPRTPFGPNMDEQWLAEGAVETRTVALGEHTLRLELRRYRFADEVEWGLRAALGEERLVLSEERTETSMGYTEATTQRATIRQEVTPLVFATLFHEGRSTPRPELRNGSWVLHAERRRSGAAHNTMVYDRLSQTLTVDVDTRRAHMLTPSYDDTTS